MRNLLVLAIAALITACSGTSGREAEVDSDTQGEVIIQRQEEVVGALAAAPGEVEVIGGDEESLREFIGRALTYPYPGSEEGGTRILIGLLPDDLPFDLPIPEGSQVIGSIVRSDPAGTEIILDSPLKSQEAIAFYQDELTGEGWSEQSQEAYGPGFVSALWPSQTFCEVEGDIVVYISAVDVPDKPTDLRVNIQSQAEYSPCKPDNTQGMDDAYFLIPPLVSPAGALVRGGGSGSGPGEANVTASLKTDLAADELADHYGEQLSEAGWDLGERGATEYEAWSSWTITDDKGEKWGGILIVVESPTDPEKRYAWFQVDKAR